MDVARHVIGCDLTQHARIRGLETRVGVNGVEGNGPSRYCSPHHRMPFNSTAESGKCALMSWRAMCVRPDTEFIMRVVVAGNICPARNRASHAHR